MNFETNIVFVNLASYICLARKSTIMLIKEIAAQAETTARTIQRDIAAFNKANKTSHSDSLKEGVYDVALLDYLQEKRGFAIISVEEKRVEMIEAIEDHIQDNENTYVLSDDVIKTRIDTPVKHKKDRQNTRTKAKTNKKTDLQTRLSADWIIGIISTTAKSCNPAKLILLVFQSYIYALLCTRVLTMINAKAATITDGLEIHVPDIWVLWVVGYVVDSGGFAIAKNLKVKDKWDNSIMNWIIAFFVFQIVIDLCYLFGPFFPWVEWVGAVAVVCSGALGLMAYARAEFDKSRNIDSSGRNAR